MRNAASDGVRNGAEDRAADKTGDRTGDRDSRPLETVSVLNPDGAGPLVLVCEHASCFIPPALNGLGLDDAARRSHVAWDPGALAVAEEMSRRLDAPLVAQRVSRLVYDCNRPPESPSAAPARSELYDIPGNAGLDAAQIAARARDYYAPFRTALKTLLDARAGRETALATVHSFTPVYLGAARDVELGVLHDADARLADALLGLGGPARFAGGDLIVERNAPYGPADGVTHTLREHALPRGMLNVMLEIRNDLIAAPGAQRAMGAMLAERLRAALQDARAAAASAHPNEAASAHPNEKAS